MARLLQIVCIIAFSLFVTAVPLQTSSKRDLEYTRNSLSDWDTPLPIRETDEIEPVPQQDLKV